jgi:hypothetical protein
LQLANHLVICDISLKLDNVIKHYKWELDKITFTDEEESHSTKWLTVLNNEKAQQTTLNAICQALAAEHRSSVWLQIFAFLGLLPLTMLLVVAGYFILTRYLWTIQARIIHLRMPAPTVAIDT